MTTAKQGGSGGVFHEWKIPKDEFVKKITVTATANVITSLTFETNKKTSATFGSGNGDTKSIIEIPDNSKIIGFSGRSAQFLNKIGFILKAWTMIR